ncbi:MAG: ABC transporter substrate-binding protein [Legionellaceae bacterium]|nr:ABC transporter substrate-binding protein [Legionellaceae bacterium]
MKAKVLEINSLIHDRQAVDQLNPSRDREGAEKFAELFLTTNIYAQQFLKILFFVLGVFFSTAHAMVWNNPYTEDQGAEKIYYSSFNESPRSLDPARSYNANEHIFTAQILEPPLQYDYMARPYRLVPLTAERMPEVLYLDADKKPWKPGSKTPVAYSVYTITIQKNLYYQPHPAFAKNSQGDYRYLPLPDNYIESKKIETIRDFPYQGTREVQAEDYVYAIKRLADPAVGSPIFGLMSGYIQGFSDFAQQLPKHRKEFLDLRTVPMSGVRVLNPYQFEITLVGEYRPFIYWLAMVFFSPTPWEVDALYHQPGMKSRNMGWNWQPVGTGPFMLTENNPNSRMVLAKNPNYRPVYFPDKVQAPELGATANAGARLPLIDKAVFLLEKEAIPRWSKFLQGYYDTSTVSADSFDQAIHLEPTGALRLTPELQEKGMRLIQLPDLSLYYLGFNDLDPIVGGRSPRAQWLRRAISLAVNYEEYIALFLNGRGVPAQGPLPVKMFGKNLDIVNPWLYHRTIKGIERRPLQDAKMYLQKAGYPRGIDPKTNRPLIIHYDVSVTSGPDEKSQLDWMRKQLSKIGIDLDIRATQYNRFQEKMMAGDAQLFSWGWLADYPDPENFLFLLYSPHGKVRHGGENASNYNNPQYDALFQKMRNLPNGSVRDALIRQMITLVQDDAPWVFGYTSETVVLNQPWMGRTKPSSLKMNTLQYTSVDVSLRTQLRSVWNQVQLWPLLWFLCFALMVFLLLYRQYRKQERRLVKRWG